eukprot:CAMPEP_0172543820 /NCGR_PEP_ID=MMETSP1067-20121228/14111_1 /TAXON_ID=265564 ORGANISM="Thalassiosira punctigera, Strain Tpunct2005C2" /NCGR_SAMPLE_ID=MMETSP1067 /ASSEMBLY_ACC=CAM_ASM_000444 /LENGTH=329 /DNA_ID=CAMNT_0013330295 /DNA_START=107 /DNA_END=1096 /DNA_ORIENTATION=-
MRPLFLTATLIVRCSRSAADAFSAASVPSSADGIKIVGLPGGKVESLPGMYVRSFRRWIVDNDVNNSDECGSAPARSSPQIEPMMGTGVFNLPKMDGEWVNPTTIDELWWPRDLTTLQVRPMLNVLFRNGLLSYVSAGLDVRVPHARSSAGKENEGGDGYAVSSWRNYGLNSQPIARIWTTLDIVMEKLFHVEAFVLRIDDEHETLFPSLDVQGVMERVATFVAELDSLSPLAEGFHIASFPMMENWTDLPHPTGSKKDGETGEDGTEVLYRIVCLATSEPFASKLLDMDEDLLTMSSTSVLEVLVSRTAKGGDSPYLTEPYKGLYLNS